MAGQKGIIIKTALLPQAFIDADKAMISTVLRNLISNAIKFTKKGGEITLIAREENAKLWVAVKDNGIGIPQHRLEKLFRIEESESTPGTSNEKGTGLGLILCKEFIEKHGGKIWAESEEGKGSVFYFNLPYKPET
jgi:signal transduction histidine kinase